MGAPLPADVVFLLDVDNTLIDNDAIQAELSRHLAESFGTACRDHYWAIFEELRAASRVNEEKFAGAIPKTSWIPMITENPAEALALAANDLGRRGLAIEPGWIVLTGGMTDAVAVPPGAVLAAHFTHLGSLFLP